MPVAEAHLFVEEFEALHHVLEIEQRLAHTHEHDVADAPRRESLEHQILSNDLSHAEIAVEAAESGRAELAAHRTTDLARYAAGNPVLVGEKNTLEDLAVTAVHEELLYAVGRRAMGGNFERLNPEALGDFVPQRFGEIGDARQIILGSLVEVEGDLARSHTSIGAISEGLLQLLSIHPDESRLRIRQGVSLPWECAKPLALCYCGGAADL
jgi:hypothetical protein